MTDHDAPLASRGSDDERVVLVDELGRAVGTMPKLRAHAEPGQWHRAFSACLLDDAGRLLLQRRAATKYHFGGRWTNTCCGHPRPGEELEAAVRRRLLDELGLGLAWSLPVGQFRYEAADHGSGRFEAEDDQVVLIGVVDLHGLTPNPREVAATAWMAPRDALRLCRSEPNAVSPWLRGVLAALSDHESATT